MRKIMLATVVALMMCVAGCASSGREMAPDQLARIQPGKTTKAQMIAMFGPPLSHGYDSSGKMMMLWHYAYVGPFGAGMRQQILSVLIDEKDLVEKYTVTDNNDAGPRLGK